MKLIYNWKVILFKAWSIRLWALATVFETMSMILPIFIDSMPHMYFSLLSLIAAGGGIWARLIEQKGIRS